MPVVENQICALENSFYWSMKLNAQYTKEETVPVPPDCPLRFAIVVFNLHEEVSHLGGVRQRGCNPC